ncbi:paraflagellar rod protein-like protein [Trypanosoma conorhini]|uniref:Paraflagellar rod protein-like protein n=1 Tax=Trypanosoma conorhini TaxID=83891 RepID=A0A3R7LAT7_9TRYP|nr:paraflagellar rod protein-like protein [Trypanosoma conorhini]RNF23406.1 paraflagellar rod protein-like protein [Trypanosoma conorhini]
MYPDRRPYATAVGHGGYLSKPLLPPVEALRILNSAVGIDVPRSLRLDAQAAADSARRIHSRPPTSGRPQSSRGVPRWRPATLESATPFSFKEKDYHTSQQAALNAQLSNAVEELFKTWHRKVRDLENYLNVYPAQSATSSSMTADAMMNYFQGYRPTDVLPVTLEQLVKDFKLGSTPEMLTEIQNSPALQTERIRRTLDTLLNAKHFLAPLEQYVQELETLASLALRDEPGEAVGGAPRGPVWLSKAAVSLHEKFHYNPAEYAMKELRKSDQPLERLERRVMEAKEQKERAIDEELPGEALNCLTSQVDLSNDLLLMNKARLELVQLHSNDVREMKPLIDAIIADARRSVELLKGRIERDLPLVKKDMESLRSDTQNTEDHIKYLTKVDADANKEARKEFRKLEDDERDLWELLLQTMRKLVNISDEKDEFVQKQMRLRDQRAYDMGLALELMKAQQQYYELLRSCDDTLWRWSSVAEVYETYVEAYVPKLLKKLNDAEEADQLLYNREAQEYVRRYEMFEYAVEEGRATRQVHADRLKVLQRSKKLDVERAAETLDPHLEKYNKELQESQAQMEEAEAYINLVEALQRERRGEVEPILQHVISHNRTVKPQRLELEGPAETLQLRDKPQPRGAAQAAPTFPEETDVSPMSTTPAPARGTDGQPVVVATDLVETSGFANAPPLTNAMKLRTGAESPLMATVAHPHVQARTIGINHEEAFLEKYRRFTDDEQCAVEAAEGKVRQTRHELDKLGLKYDNVDYVRMLLGAPGRGHTASIEDGHRRKVSGEVGAQ